MTPKPQRKRATELHRPDFTKPLPASEENEKAAVSCLLQWPKEVQAMMVSRGITREYITIPAYKGMAIACFDLLSKGAVVDFATVTQTLRDRGLLESVGGPAQVSEMFTHITTSTGCATYLDTLMAKYALRTLILEGTALVKRGYEEPETLEEIIGDFTKTASTLAQIGQRATKPTIADIMMRIVNNRQKMMDSGAKIAGMTTFLPELDDATGGLRKAQLRYVSAPPGGGKTILMMNNAEAVAIHHKLPVLIFSLELPAEELMERVTASIAGVNLYDIQNNRLNDEQERAWAGAVSKLSGSPITIEDEDMDIHKISAIARAWKAHNPDGALIVIDYLGLIKRRARDNRSTADEIAADSRALKALAKELSVCIEVGSQLTGESSKGSRAPEEDGDVFLRITDSAIVIKKCRTGAKGKEIPILIDAPRMRIVPAEEEPEPPRRKRSKKTDNDI